MGTIICSSMRSRKTINTFSMAIFTGSFPIFFCHFCDFAIDPPKNNKRGIFRTGTIFNYLRPFDLFIIKRKQHGYELCLVLMVGLSI